MKHILIALGIMAASHCKCPKHYNNPSLVSGYTIKMGRTPSHRDIKRSMEEADRIFIVSSGPVRITDSLNRR
jgi:hypothetical protein